MGEVCRVCAHPQNDEIDARLLDGEPGRSVARAFGLSEASVRRHRDGHATRESAPEAPGAPGRPADAPEAPEPQEDPATVAARLLMNEEQQRRAQRLAELTAEEEERRYRAAAEEERAAALEGLRAQADVLAVRRAEVEDRADDQAAVLKTTLEELEDLDGRHTRILSRAGLLPAGQQPVGRLVERWLRVALGRFSPGGGVAVAVDPHKGAPLRYRDPLAKVPDAREVQGPPPAA